MPGLVVFRRRWSVGSDDLVVPGVFLFTVHLIWAIILSILLVLVEFNRQIQCTLLLWGLVIGYLVILGLSMIIELWICIIAMRGSILNTAPRASMQHLLYFRLAVMGVEAGWLSVGIAWFVNYYFDCKIENAKETVFSMIVFNWCILLSVVITVWCTYDSAGRSWVKMKQYQRSMKEAELRFQYKRSGSTRNWRQRKVIRAYQNSWHKRFRFLFCCSTPSDRNRNSFAEIARLLSDFFRDLDVVPSDVVAGLVLLRKFQKIERTAIIEQRQNDTYEFLSGVPITPRTQFLALHEDGDFALFQSVIHYAHFAFQAYGWPVYMMSTKMGLCHICANLQCCCFRKSGIVPEIIEDNCCKCHYAALQKLSDLGDIEIIYVTYHVDVGETPFFVALDYDRHKIVISIRGTLSMKDILTDLNAEAETLPLMPIKEDWLGHKGMVQAAQYILMKLHEEQLIEKALNHNMARNTSLFELVVVGHSLGAGTACILSILLRQHYPSLECFCYSPPGGLLSCPAMEYTKQFTISVVVGKDVVPRIGLAQMEAFRADLINAIKRSVDPKWKTIICSIICCGCTEPTSAMEMSSGESDVCEYMRSKQSARSQGIHPSDCTISLTSHQPLYPPGRIIHVVRHHPTRGEQKYEKRWRQALTKKDPVYQALWAQNTDLDEVLISPVMIQDHMPDTVMDALNKVITTMGPRKPQRIRYEEEIDSPPKRLYLETSFTSLHSPVNSATYPPSLVKCQSLTLKPTLDLIHDDWFGLAPLASPESLSELSSISSRTSLVMAPEVNTPKIMKRTPKIIGSLSTCADDIRNVRNFQMSKIFRRNGSPATNSSNSYESASSDPVKFSTKMDHFQSAEDILDNVLTVAGCKDFFNSKSSFELLEELKSPNQRDDPDLLSNLAIDLHLGDENHSLQFHNRNDTSKPNSVDSGSVCRTPSDHTKYVTFNPQVINIDPQWTLFKRNHRKCDTPKTILCPKRRNSEEDCFSRCTPSEALPLLSGLSVTSSERTSPNFLRRKVYPVPPPFNRRHTANGGESSV